MASDPEATTGKRLLLLDFPSEILAGICQHLPNSDIKSLRLAAPSLCHAVPPRFTRVFLSPDPSNLAVFRAVAAHPTFRLGVREIVVDDARLPDITRRRDCFNDTTNQEERDISASDNAIQRGLEASDNQQVSPGSHGVYSSDPEPMMMWFSLRRQRNRLELRGRHANDSGNVAGRAARDAQRAAEPPVEQTYQHYRDLLRAQEASMETGEDMQALVDGLAAFPALERITITPATHGFLYTPLYYTPMIRNLPYGFNYPLPRGWPTSKERPLQETLLQELFPWVPSPGWTADSVEREKARWRGLVLVLRALATRVQDGGSAVPELVMDVHSLNTGVSPYMLAQECEERDYLALILRQPGFRRLDLPILLAGVQPNDVALLGNGLLKSLLAEARDLKHFRLRGDGQLDPASPSPQRFFPLKSLLPLDTWSSLRHFGLSKFVVRVPDLVDALGALPATLRTVELSFLIFSPLDMGRRENHGMLLKTMREKLKWADRLPEARPRVTMGLAKAKNNVEGRGLWFSDEIGTFLYESGQNPFGWQRDVLLPGAGWVADEYDADFARPEYRRCVATRDGCVERGDDMDPSLCWLPAQQVDKIGDVWRIKKILDLELNIQAWQGGEKRRLDRCSDCECGQS
ncbi:hypothetical protein CCM_03593 [Cordyceps militaris CM01]|uniref:Cyclin-like F-box n=1 Tax=Cordyceps militaris (strain CM01) TaxID=983644 RepID=G3JBL6_CORMM|nr:uncharacterized protein CCM_03593 [Cordyceps militaris CM01]EGX95321.1 hypothetical protein CCM_03593 [Cordyceps militaris CM01]